MGDSKSPTPPSKSPAQSKTSTTKPTSSAPKSKKASPEVLPDALSSQSSSVKSSDLHAPLSNSFKPKYSQNQPISVNKTQPGLGSTMPSSLVRKTQQDPNKFVNFNDDIDYSKVGFFFFFYYLIM
jgi:hypothetical protein